MAENASGQERTEQPTAKRRQEARREGQIARSPDLTAAVVLLTGAMALAMTGVAALGGYASGLMREAAHALTAGELTVPAAATLIRSILLGLLGALTPFVIGAMAAAVAAGLAQTKGSVSWGPLRPKLERLDPLAGLKRMVNLESLFTLLKASAKLIVLGVVTGTVLMKSWPELASLPGSGPAGVALIVKSLSFKLVFLTGLAFLAIALVDFGFQWYRTERQLKMSRQEVVQEHRESEGNPHVKARIFSLGRARARRRMLQRVPTADVVIVNPTEIAIALKYDLEQAAAPIVVAMGQRKLAERIKALAYKSNVPVIENRPVARALLATAKVDRPIPPALYAAVAEILAYVYRRRGKNPFAPAGPAGGGART